MKAFTSRQVSAPLAPPHNDDALNTPSVSRTNCPHAAARVDAPVGHGMDEIGMAAFLRQQID